MHNDNIRKFIVSSWTTSNVHGTPYYAGHGHRDIPSPVVREEDTAATDIPPNWREIYGGDTVRDLPRCGYRRMFANRTNPKLHVVLSLPCGRWGCQRCGPVLKGKYETHLLAAGVPLEVIDPGEGGYDKWKRRLQRLGARYARLKMDDGRILIVTTEKGVGQPVGAEKIRELICGVAFTKRAIWMSHSWSLKKAGHPRHGRRNAKDPEWDHLGPAKSKPELRRVLEKEGVELLDYWDSQSFTLKEEHMGLLRYSVLIWQLTEDKYVQ